MQFGENQSRRLVFTRVPWATPGYLGLVIVQRDLVNL
jgi:hypothetical protein